MPLILSNLPSLFLFNITMIVLAHITKYSNIFVRNLRIFEYIRTLTFQWSEYSNIFVFQFSYIRIRISNIRPKIFEYSNIFEYSLRSASSIVICPCPSCSKMSSWFRVHFWVLLSHDFSVSSMCLVFLPFRPLDC